MKRFFGTSAVLRKVPPGAPTHVKQVPIPRTAKSTADINKYIDVSVGHEAMEPSTNEVPSSFLSRMFPDANSELKLKSSEGVWYHVDRSRSGNLPVYLDYNNAGGVWTEIRKINGNVGALRNDLRDLLALSKSDIWIKNAAQTVVIKGNHRHVVKEILESKF